MATMTQIFGFAEDGYYENGVGSIECVVTEIPAGVDRLFDIVTKDSDSNILTTGSMNAALLEGVDTEGSIYLTPATYTSVSLDVLLNDSTEYGKMKYYAIPHDYPGSYRVTLTSAAHDTDLYVFNADGSIYSNASWTVGSPANFSFGATLSSMTYRR